LVNEDRFFSFSILDKRVKADSPAVHNDFHQTDGLFPLFDGLHVKDINKAFESDIPLTSGYLPNGEGI
jgi:hypothetical protein